MNSIDERKTKEPIRTTCDDACDLTVRNRIIGMKRSEEHRLGYPGPGGAEEIFVQRRVGIPRSRQPVTFAGVAVAVDNHAMRSSCGAIMALPDPQRSAPISARNRVLLSMPLWK